MSKSSANNSLSDRRRDHAKPRLDYWISHLIVRSIVVLNLATVIGEFYYYEVLRHAGLEGAIIKWYIASSLILPIYVGLEIWWMGRAESKALLVDAALAIVWFLTWWGIFLYLVYVLSHRVWL